MKGTPFEYLYEPDGSISLGRSNKKLAMDIFMAYEACKCYPDDLTPEEDEEILRIIDEFSTQGKETSHEEVAEVLHRRRGERKAQFPKAS